MNELGLFAGAGGGLLASKLLGWHTVCAVEIEPYCQRVLAQRQRDGHLEPFPIWDDIRTFDGRPWCGRVDVVSGGFPCQDISSAGKGAGLDGDHSGLWYEMLRVIGEVRPAYVFAENSPMLRTRGLGTVVSGLAGLGYACAWGVLGAWHVGAPHRRNRMWIVGALTGASGAEIAYARRGTRYSALPHHSAARGVPTSGVPTYTRRVGGHGGASGGAVIRNASWGKYPDFAGVDDGVADRVERVRATGNGQVPAVAALAWRVLAPLAREAGGDRV